MEVVKIINVFLLLIAAVLIVVVVLMQDSKNSGLGSAFGSETTALSVRGKKASREKQLQKITIILAIIIAVLAILMLLIPAITKWITPADTSSFVDTISNVL